MRERQRAAQDHERAEAERARDAKQFERQATVAERDQRPRSEKRSPRR